jgi:hypothetical protein
LLALGALEQRVNFIWIQVWLCGAGSFSLDPENPGIRVARSAIARNR